jgi:hypothetical protein
MTNKRSLGRKKPPQHRLRNFALPRFWKFQRREADSYIPERVPLYWEGI